MDKADISFIDIPRAPRGIYCDGMVTKGNEVVIHCGSPKGAAWIAKYVTTNVAPLHCEREHGLKTLRKMFDDGLKVERLLGDGRSEKVKDCSELS